VSAADEHRGLAGLTPDELRAAVREVLRDVLPAAVTDRQRRPEVPDEVVALADDADLDAFVRRVAVRCADPAERAALAEGRHGYRLRTAGPADAANATSPGPGVTRVERGAVTERTVARAAAAGGRLVLGRRAVLTPLGRDRARSLGVTVEKES
jgi:hypothetical protein